MHGSGSTIRGKTLSGLALAVLLTGMFVTLLDTMIANVALPSIASDLHAPIGHLELVLAGYSMSYGVLLVTGGRLGDIYGRKRVFLLGLVGFTLASLLCGLAPSSIALVGARLAQGAMAAILSPQVYAMLRTGSASEAERRRAFGWLGLTLGLGAISGQIVGGLLIDADLAGLGWRMVFLINLPIGLGAALVGRAVLPVSPERKGESLDLAGVALGSLALGLLIVALVEGPEHSWPLWTVLALLAAPPAIGVFLWWETGLERRGGAPVFAPSLLQHRAFRLAMLAVLVFYATPNALFMAIAILLQQGLGYGPTVSGLIFLPAAAAFSFASLRAPRLVERHGRRTLQAGGLIYASGMALLGFAALLYDPRIEAYWLVPGMLMFGTGLGLLTTQLLSVALGSLPASQAGVASGVTATMQQVGSCLGVALLGIVLFGVIARQPASLPRAEAVGEAFAIAMGCTVLAALLTVLLLRVLPRYATADRPGA